MTDIIGVVSGKGGVGTTTSVVNIGCALTSFGRDCVVVDGDLKKSNVGMQLGSANVEKTLHDVMQGKHRIHDSAYMHSSGMKVIMGKSDHDVFELKIKSDGLRETVFNLVGACEVVLIDCGCGHANYVRDAIRSVDKLVIVVEADLVSILETIKLIQYAKKCSVEIIGAIVNKHYNDGINLELQNIEQMIGIPIIGVVPFDHDVRKSLYLKHPVCYSHPDSNAAVSFKKIAAKLIGQEYEHKLDVEEKHSSFKKALKLFGLSGK